MTSIDTHHAAGTAAAPPAVAVWITSADHKQVGRLYAGTGLVGLLAGLVLAVLVAFERIDAEGYQLLDTDSATQVLAAARLLLTFGAVAPLLLGLAVAIVPLQLGARSLALPRLAAGGFWMWLTGLGLAVASIIANGGPGGGSSEMVDLYLLGTIVMSSGLLMTATSVATSVLTTRAPGMGLLRAPLFAWSALVGSVTMLLALPVFVGTSIYLWVDHKYARAAFGGNVGVSDWAGWALSQPFTYLLAIPALGMVLDIVPVMGRTSLAQRTGAYVALGIVSIATLATVTQTMVTLPWDGDSFFDNAGDKIADLLPWGLLTVIPLLGVLGVLGTSALTLKNGKPRVAAPLVFAMHGLLTIVLGVAAHILGSIDDAGVRGSIFEAGTYVAITFGSVTVAFGALCYWGPKLWGRRISDKAALPLALLALLATALGSIPYMIAGFADQPAGALDGFAYDGPQELWNTLTTAGFALMLLTSLGFIALAAKSFTSGEAAGDDPWDGQTLEWATSSPPPADNFSDLAVVGSATPLLDLKSASNGKDA
ncbi:MAG: cbb3-type cytochrome c oxidase subunit I [Ilumatobacteraceae bacterium]|jgi:heme/copper-type cytochrome/quinol oxidase subunit 1|nr:cbb3-type cytochrome c oxidase subunit I [Ilumatobacteraceae bacterium]